MEYRTVAEARDLPGLRLVLSVETPGPWGISARALFDVRKVAYVPVAQHVMQPNLDLVAWTGRRNAPVAVYESEAPVDSWLDIMNLAERLGSGPSLFPGDPVDRALAVGFSAEICGAGGFGWARRLGMLRAGGADGFGGDTATMAEIARAYGIEPAAVAAAPARVAGVMRGLAARLHSQRATGSRYLVGDRVLACDIHWACFSMLVRRLPEDQCRLPPGLGDMFDTLGEEERAAFDPILIEHCDHVWREHIGLPLDY